MSTTLIHLNIDHEGPLDIDADDLARAVWAYLDLSGRESVTVALIDPLDTPRVAQCHDCGEVRPIHPDSDAQRGEPICYACVAGGAFLP